LETQDGDYVGDGGSALGAYQRRLLYLLQTLPMPFLLLGDLTAPLLVDVELIPDETMIGVVSELAGKERRHDLGEQALGVEAGSHLAHHGVHRDQILFRVFSVPDRPLEMLAEVAALFGFGDLDHPAFDEFLQMVGNAVDRLADDL